MDPSPSVASTSGSALDESPEGFRVPLPGRVDEGGRIRIIGPEKSKDQPHRHQDSERRFRSHSPPSSSLLAPSFAPEPVGLLP